MRLEREHVGETDQDVLRHAEIRPAIDARQTRQIIFARRSRLHADQTGPGFRTVRVALERCAEFLRRIVDAAKRAQHVRAHHARGQLRRIERERSRISRFGFLAAQQRIAGLAEVEPRRHELGSDLARTPERIDRAFGIAGFAERAAEIVPDRRIVRTQRGRAMQELDRLGETLAHVQRDGAQAQDFRMIGRCGERIGERAIGKAEFAAVHPALRADHESLRAGGEALQAVRVGIGRYRSQRRRDRSLRLPARADVRGRRRHFQQILRK